MILEGKTHMYISFCVISSLKISGGTALGKGFGVEGLWELGP